MMAPQTDPPPQRWHTPTGEPCPRAERLDGTIDGTADCLCCGFCLLLADLVERSVRATDQAPRRLAH